jgi:hypothetical protein
MAETVAVQELGRVISFSFDDLIRYHGPGSPAGVAVSFKALQRAIGLLSPDQAPPRRAISVRTAFRGPGARDGFEAVTRAVSDGRYTVDRALLRPDRGQLLEDFVFEVDVDGSRVMLVLRDGYVTEEFIGLARTPDRTADQEARLGELKLQLAQALLAAPADDVFDIVAGPDTR